MSDDTGKIDQSLRHAVRDAALASLARDTAHDLKGILNVITMNVELLSRSAQDPVAFPLTAEQVRHCADALQRKLRRLDRSIDVILGHRTDDADPRSRVDLTECCGRALDLVASRAAKQRVEVTFTSTQPVFVSGCCDDVELALLALLVNALDAMPDGGRLNVATSDRPTPTACISDSGAGVAPDRLDDIWRLHFTTKPHGTGLGLTVARQIVEDHGGALSYRPNDGGGSSFVIELPRPVSN
jgi:signal transduction histidine kinase